MVQILGLKREIRIAFCLNGSIRPLKWNRNVIRNQCIRTCLDISTIPPFTLSLSLPPSCVSLSITFSLSIAIITAWRTRCGLGLNVESCRLSHASHAEVHHGNKVCEEKRGEEKNTTKSTSLHTPLTSILFVRLTCEKGLPKGCQEERDGKRQTVILALPRLSHYGVHG